MRVRFRQIRYAKLLLFCSFFIFFSFLALSQINSVFVQVSAAEELQGNIENLTFRETDIRTVIRSIAARAYRDGRKVNIVTGPEVTGIVSIELEDVNWLTALEVVIRPFDYGYEWVRENTIVVDKVDRIAEREVRDMQRQQTALPRTRVFNLSYLDANDAKRAVEPLLSGAGRATVLEITGQAGWELGTAITTRERAREKRVSSKTKVLVISDTARKLDEISSLIDQIDVRPSQILIEATIMEVRDELLDDFGFQWEAESIDLSSSGSKVGVGRILRGSGMSPESASLDLAFEKLTGNKFKAFLKAIKEDTHTNILSSPTILTLDGQEASILVGQKYPIVETAVSPETSQITGGSLEYYQDIGIQLNVIPQVMGQDREFVSMLVYPVVSSWEDTVDVGDPDGVTLVSYPIIHTREAQTQVLMRDGETIVIGGLLEDTEIESEISVPFFGNIPILGALFRRKKSTVDKVDLIISVTAYIMDTDEIDLVELAEPDKVIERFQQTSKDE